MKLRPFPATSLGAIVLTGLICSLSPPTRAQSGPETKSTVGTFSRPMIAQVFYRSELWKEQVRTLAGEQNEAARAGDAAKVDQIDRQLNAMQALAQKQLSGDIPLKNIYDLLKAEWPAIAQEAGVDLIVEPPLYQAPGARVVDVTPFIVKRFAGKKN
ncbi:MAG: hypothetical protein PHE83_01180 [Opitutaceae bacterium]|nr:hypothetical protein [Opitutaceae bacterium]